MDTVYENSVVVISSIQNQFKHQSELMFMISNLFDPRYAFLFYAPLLFSLDRYTGRKLMWVTVIAEWSNQILKWVLRGERPYWWVPEANLRNSSAAQEPVKQFSMTCETGPGSPSGHAMITAAVFYILVEALLKQRGRRTKSSMLDTCCWSIYTLILCSVSLSRIYIAAHFPHQCLLGAVIGIAVAKLISQSNTDAFERKHYIMGTVGMFSIVMMTYFAISSLGFDPLWSVGQAIKWCSKPEYVHIDTTPFFSMMRYLGFFFGMGLGLYSSAYKMASKVHFTPAMRIVTAILAVGVTKASEFVVLPKGQHVCPICAGLYHERHLALSIHRSCPVHCFTSDVKEFKEAEVVFPV
ncbi:Glucose-6-phosphatase 2 [Halotydeus destructor]|nr:Glucose-6-phosphatase 2 [Halotydeus destructor]